MSSSSDLEAEIGRRRRKCYLCKSRSPGDLCQFWAGFCVSYEKQDLVDEVHIRAEYRDLKRYSVTVCDECAAKIRRKKHLLGAIAWGVGFVACAVGVLVANAKQIAGDDTVYAVSVLWFFTALCALLALLEVWQMQRGQWSPEVTRTVLKEVKRDLKYKKRGDTFFTPEEYHAMFPDSEDEPLTAEEILARDRTGP